MDEAGWGRRLRRGVRGWVEVQGRIAPIGLRGERIKAGRPTSGALVQIRLAAGAGSSAAQAGIRVVLDGVGRSSDPRHPATEHLVPHGVSKGLDGIRALDLIAVVVEPDVQVAQAVSAVSAEDGATRRPQGRPPEADRSRMRRWERGLVGIGRLTSPPVGDTWPQELSEIVETIEQADAACGEGGDLRVDLGQLELDPGTVGLQPDSVVPEGQLMTPGGKAAGQPCAGSTGSKTPDRRGLGVGWIGRTDLGLGAWFDHGEAVQVRGPVWEPRGFREGPGLSRGDRCTILPRGADSGAVVVDSRPADGCNTTPPET